MEFQAVHILVIHDILLSCIFMFQRLLVENRLPLLAAWSSFRMSLIARTVTVHNQIRKGNASKKSLELCDLPGSKSVTCYLH